MLALTFVRSYEEVETTASGNAVKTTQQLDSGDYVMKPLLLLAIVTPDDPPAPVIRESGGRKTY